jgi:NAD(P)-dependent dehydrogenase (short-subunit alcohol dehydrogenase family)
MGLFDDKVAVVTGAGRGLGRAEAILLASEGAAVVVNDLGGSASGEGADEGPAHDVVREIRAAGGEATANGDDIASWEGGQHLIGDALEQYGRLDILVNNAGILRDRMSFNMEESDWDAVINVHLKGHFVPSRFAGAYWRQESKRTGAPVNAKIVNTSSEAGLYGNAGQLNYAAAKAGIASMTIVLARELERFGVRVNGIAPVARTRLIATVSGMDDDALQPAPGEFDRWAPENVAAVVAWLASDLSAGVSGQIVKVQGGVMRIMRGWGIAAEATADELWTTELVDQEARRLFDKVAPSVPPFPRS